MPAERRGQGECRGFVENPGRKEVPSVEQGLKRESVRIGDKLKIKYGKRVTGEDLLAEHRMRMN